MNETKLGSIIEGEAFQDAVHVPVKPMIATCDLLPGQRINTKGLPISENENTIVLIVDPFLKDPVKQGQKFFACLQPGQVTSLTHLWSHPSFPEEKQKIQISRDPNDRSWRTQTVIDLCEQMINAPKYQKQYKTNLPILADALEDAGCPDTRVLTKMRQDKYFSEEEEGHRLVCLVYSNETEEAVRWIDDFADDINQGYRGLMEAAYEYAEDGEYIHMGNNEGYKNASSEQWDKFWQMYEIITKFKMSNNKSHSFFTCSC